MPDMSKIHPTPKLSLKDEAIAAVRTEWSRHIKGASGQELAEAAVDVVTPIVTRELKTEIERLERQLHIATFHEDMGR